MLATIEDCLFEGNEAATFGGGAIYACVARGVNAPWPEPG